ncbi:MAG TPA: hypothetical protein VN363_00185, partial [Anaerolineales bacterium]|nr:hypothetical protein [Anaerolineales bacterium]
MKRWKSIPVLFCLLLLSSACLPSATPEVNPRGPGTPTLSDEAVLGTKVAATLTAILPASSPVADTPQPGTPEATSPPAASPTSLQPTKAQPTLTTPVAMAAYAREGVVYLWTEGTIRPLTSTGTEVFTVILSDDGRWVAYTRQVDDLRQEIWAVQTGGMDGERLMSSADFAAIDPAALAVLPNQIGWVPGSHTLAFNTHQVFEGPGVSPYDDLHLIDVDTFERRTPFL